MFSVYDRTYYTVFSPGVSYMYRNWIMLNRVCFAFYCVGLQSGSLMDMCLYQVIRIVHGSVEWIDQNCYHQLRDMCGEDL